MTQLASIQKGYPVTYLVPVINDENEKFFMHVESDSYIKAVIKTHRFLNCQHEIDMELLGPVLTKSELDKLELQREIDHLQQKLKTLYKIQYATLNGWGYERVIRKRMQPLKQQERELKAKIADLEAELMH
ncbi:hypothetical protein [Paenibacillus sp. 23TSA30-6]|uniref:hypothetical protein n=1 Tax=Paenibacillus sp. 23TSA30-6 TaxID=2546104 RepID=UPI0017879291|nr:hypothetical protein [Paenibacillus sp. 23TSA30-6]MBE0335083.1 hypothetical protein [Paenibacillus sp. 23TSA30-6]